MPPPSVAVYASQIHTAVTQQDSRALSFLFALAPPPHSRDNHADDVLDWLGRGERGNAWVDRTLHATNPGYVSVFKQKLSGGACKNGPWADMATAHVWALVALRPPPHLETGQLMYPPDFAVAYAKTHELVTALYRYLIDARDAQTGWLLPLLFQVCKDLRGVAQQADDYLLSTSQKATKLEEASRLFQKCFSACLNDRAADPLMSRKMGTYFLANLLFKVYFRLNSTTLCRNIIRGINASDLPPLSRFPRAHQVTYTYYMGVFAFLREDYDEAEKRFEEALRGTHRKVTRNISLILDYLIPLLLRRGILPSPRIYKRSSNATHESLFKPFAEAIKDGDVAAYDRQLEREEKRLMQRGTYLVVEKARENAVRGCLKKAWILEGKPARLSIEKFREYYNAAQRVGAEGGSSEAVEVDAEEMECLLAVMVYKGLIKGYISHTHQLVVLSKEKPFPWFAPYRPLDTLAAQDRARREMEERQRKVEVLPVVGENGGAASGA
ncbi:hypothetical protein JCM8547_004648 [Rhodosporidiobolus lusitaniae]